jgi:hypothetical protein
MTKFTVNVPEKLSSYLELLDYNINSRKNLLMEMVSRYGIKDKNVKLYEQEYHIYYAKFEMAKNAISAIIVPDKLKPFTNWSIIYDQSVMEIEVNTKVDSKARLIELVQGNLMKGNFIEEAIDQDIEKELEDTYDTDFDDEKGIINAGECATGNCNKK